MASTTSEDSCKGISYGRFKGIVLHGLTFKPKIEGFGVWIVLAENLFNYKITATGLEWRLE